MRDQLTGKHLHLKGKGVVRKRCTYFELDLGENAIRDIGWGLLSKYWAVERKTGFEFLGSVLGYTTRRELEIHCTYKLDGHKAYHPDTAIATLDDDGVWKLTYTT